MGLGGHLMWTPLAREIVTQNPNIKVLPVERVKPGIFPSIVSSEIFRFNPNFVNTLDDDHKIICISLDDARTNYCKLDAFDHCIQRYDKHVIQQICDVYGFNDVKLKCELYLSDEEQKFGHDFRGFIVIDPHTKDEYTVNKRYPFKKWQRVIDVLRSRGFKNFVQVGRKTSEILDGVQDMTGLTTFRQAAALIKQADLFLGSEGGLMHAANAVETPAVIVVTGFLHPTMTCYPENTNIWIGAKHGPCGLKVKCEKCYDECIKHDEFEIVEAVEEKI